MVISEGWDIPRACMLYQIRDSKSKQLDEQVMGRKDKFGEMGQQIFGDDYDDSDQTCGQQILLDLFHMAFQQVTGQKERHGQQRMTVPLVIVKPVEMVQRQAQQIKDGNQPDLPGPRQAGEAPEQDLSPEEGEDEPGTARDKPGGESSQMRPEELRLGTGKRQDAVTQQIQQHGRQDQRFQVFQEKRPETDREGRTETGNQEERLHEKGPVGPDARSHYIKNGIVQSLPCRKNPAMAEEQTENQDSLGGVDVSDALL